LAKHPPDTIEAAKVKELRAPIAPRHMRRTNEWYAELTNIILEARREMKKLPPKDESRETLTLLIKDLLNLRRQPTIPLILESEIGYNVVRR
jgi:hypothetical protein